MDYQNVFKRYEIKYMLDEKQYAAILSAMQDKTTDDDFFKSTIRNIYFDTPDYYLIRRSLEKPVYKEKLRIRSYKTAKATSKVFVELKKKYKSVVYKRRVALPDETAEKSLLLGHFTEHNQITNEIEYFIQHYTGIRPAVYISYEREAYKATDGSGIRITFDRNILYRTDNLTLVSEPYGTPILEDGKVLMELKTSGGLPLWLVKVLSREHIYKTSFSKYGTVYERALFKPQIQGTRLSAQVADNKLSKGELIYV